MNAMPDPFALFEHTFGDRDEARVQQVQRPCDFGHLGLDVERIGLVGSLQIS